MATPRFLCHDSHSGREAWIRYDERSLTYDIFADDACQAYIGNADNVSAAKVIAQDWFDDEAQAILAASDLPLGRHETSGADDRPNASLLAPTRKARSGHQEKSMTQWSHTFEISFDVLSECEHSSDVQGAALRKALQARLDSLTDAGLVETCSCSETAEDFDGND